MDAEPSLSATNFCCHYTFVHKLLGRASLHALCIGLGIFGYIMVYLGFILAFAYSCVCLFHRQVLKYSNDLNETEFSFFLFGGQVFDRSGQPANPSPDWINQSMWDNIVEADSKLESFKGLEGSKLFPEICAKY